MSKSVPAPLAPIELDDVLGLSFPLPPADPSWLNDEGDATATRGQIQAWTRSFEEALAAMKRSEQDADETAGVHAHTMGTYLRMFRGCSAWKKIDIESYDDFCAQHLRISKRHAQRLVFFAAISTEEQAAAGLRKCLAGFALARILGVDGIGALASADGAEPPEWAARLGEPVAYTTSTAARLERLLAIAAKPALPDASPNRKLAALVDVRRTVIARVAVRRPVLTALGARCFARGGNARIEHDKASTVEEFAALRAMYAALEKA